MSDRVKGRASRSGGPRSAARLAAVQALYQVELTGVSGTVVTAEFVKYWLGREIDGDEYLPADETLFRTIVAGVIEHQAELDPVISAVLTAEWPLERLETILRAILRAAAFELAQRIDTPARVVITEYVDIAHAFFTGKEPGLINGVLDRMARRCRAAEWAGDAG
ncbi:MAG: transcription antitermination factor NusB [Aliidongia sp.]